MTVEKKNPANVAPPIGRYKHLAIVPANSDILAIAGQVGLDSDGNLPTTVEEQLENALKNIAAILASEGLDAGAVFKINIWLSEQIDMDRYVAAWRAFHRDDPPATMFAYVARLIRPEYLCEVEAWAARPVARP
jgi:ribosomal-protein-alanine N-acetyltransferase